MVLVDGVPLLEDDLLPASSRLSGDELLQVADGIVGVALHADFLPQTIVASNFNHFLCFSILVSSGTTRGCFVSAAVRGVGTGTSARRWVLAINISLLISI